MRVKDGVLKYGFVGPALIFLIAFNIFPLFYNIYLSFTNAELSGGVAQLIGGRNYGVIFDDTRYGTALRTTGLFVVLAVAVELLLGFALALALQKPFWGKPAITTILLVPMMLSPAVMGLYWNFILNGHYGVVNQALSVFGLYQPQWLTDPDLKLFSILMDRHLDVDALYDAHRTRRSQTPYPITSTKPRPLTGHPDGLSFGASPYPCAPPCSSSQSCCAPQTPSSNLTSSWPSRDPMIARPKP